MGHPGFTNKLTLENTQPKFWWERCQVLWIIDRLLIGHWNRLTRKLLEMNRFSYLQAEEIILLMLAERGRHCLKDTKKERKRGGKKGRRGMKGGGRKEERKRKKRKGAFQVLE